MKKTIYLIIFVVLLLTTLVLGKQTKAGFGVSPPNIIADKLIKGSHYESVVYLTQGRPEQDLKVDIGINIDEKIKNWISIEGGISQLIPTGVQQFPLKVIIDVPKDAENGKYKGFLSVSTIPVAPEKLEGGNVIRMTMGGRIELDLTVGENVVQDFKVLTIAPLNIRQGDLLKAMVKIENIGNVNVRPERVTFDLFDKYGDIRLAFAEANMNKVKEVEPFKTQEVKVSFPIDLKLGLGEYWGEIKVYKDGRVEKSNKTTFNVLKQNIFLKYLWLFIMVGAVVLLLGGAFGVKKIVRKRK